MFVTALLGFALFATVLLLAVAPFVVSRAVPVGPATAAPGGAVADGAAPTSAGVAAPSSPEDRLAALVAARRRELAPPPDQTGPEVLQ